MQIATGFFFVSCMTIGSGPRYINKLIRIVPIRYDQTRYSCIIVLFFNELQLKGFCFLPGGRVIVCRVTF